MKRYIESFQHHFTIENDNLADWPAFNVAFKTTKELFLQEKLDGTNIRREEWIESTNKYFFGKPDEVRKIPDGIVIRDYKFKTNARTLNEDPYIDQLHFYAMIIEDLYPSKQIFLELVGVNGAYLQVSYDRARRDDLEQKAIKFVHWLKEIGSVKTTFDELCSGCELCDDYLNREIVS